MQRPFMPPLLRETLLRTAKFYDARKVGDVGCLGFRRSSDLTALFGCLDLLFRERIIIPERSSFLDLGCADGRVNVFFSYIVRASVGVELDAWTLDEYAPLRAKLEKRLQEEGLCSPPQNIHLFHGDSMDPEVPERIFEKTGIALEEFDLFYTYLVMHEEFADLIRRRAKPGSVFMVYGLDKIIPRYPDLKLIEPPSSLNGILALYRKV